MLFFAIPERVEVLDFKVEEDNLQEDRRTTVWSTNVYHAMQR